MTFKLKYFDCDLDENLQMAINKQKILFICPKTSALRLGVSQYTDLGGFDFIEVEVINEDDSSSDRDYRPKTYTVTHRTLFTPVEIE